MTTIALHPTPAFRVVMKEQIRAVGLALRKEGIVFLVFLGVIGVLGIAAALQGHVDVSPRMNHSLHAHDGVIMSWETSSNGDMLGGVAVMVVSLVGLTLPFGLAAFLVPFGVWRSDDPSRRSYHWAMPVTRGSHTLIKMLSGWLWLMLTVAVYVVFVSALSIIIASRVGAYDNPMNMIATWRVITLFAATTIVYVSTSVAVIGSNHPWRWIGGVVVLYVISLSCLAVVDQRELAHALGRIVTGKYGLLVALGGDLVSGESQVSVMMWLKAMALWLAAGGIGVCVAAYRRGNADAV